MELKSIRDALLAVLEKYRDRIVFAYLFGSAAEGEMHPSSDIDVAVYVSDKKAEDHFDIRLSLHADLCRALKRNDIDLLILNRTKNLILLDEIIRHGEVLFDSDIDFRYDFENRILHMAIDFRAQRYSNIGV